MSKYILSAKKETDRFSVWSVFVDEFMPKAHPAFVTVYLYGLRQCFSADPKCDTASCAAALQLLESDVVKAWKYWESVGVVKLNYFSGENETDFGIEFNDLSAMPQESHIIPTSRPEYKTKEITAKMKEDKQLRCMFEHVQSILGKTLSENDTRILFSLYDWLDLPPEVIVFIVAHCVQLNHKSIRYAEKVAISWADLGINTIEKAEKHIEAKEKAGKVKRKYKKLFHLGDRDMSDAEYAHVVEWTENLKFSDALLTMAYEKCIQYTGRVSFPYMNSILQSWYKQGIKTPEQVQEEKKPEKPALRAANKTRFSNFSETANYDVDEIEKLERQMHLKQN